MLLLKRSGLPRALMLCLTALLLASCANGGDFCLLAQTIGIEDDDVLTDKTARKILQNDLTYEARCK